jgi:hypothetical protein
MTYAVRGTSIIHELLQDEVIIANLDAGIYYSIREGGIVVWQLLLAGLSVDAIESLLTQKYGQIPSITPFVDKILEEELLLPVESSSSSLPALSWPATFEPPTIERYDEMKNLLMLDPIHEVDEQGWPQRK